MARQRRRWRIARWVVLGVAGLITLLMLVLVLAAYRNDSAIESNLGAANAEVLSVGWDRTIVRFETADGAVHISQDGVLYPGGLVEGQLVHVEYDVTNPDLVRVAGRTFTLSLLPTGVTIAVTWLIAGPLLWWLRRRESPA
ncbi:DUF3592 domain-containing protein [Haloechinothrix halophila]|uniref:DUF3592 domain-containing protein n=1 Tax=Haloechinothrix halophila YIM 93223 TaxID=592678 RepID=W9DST1_9PSEU|nr:DUF3592 domain-containing protein [Haloechinothrix halophila]ETA66491.1 hypothetical protein AmyhaDRAFT_0250 [Haloechinothrix halophila YIM 93223]